jgi:hypothetical protein
MLLRLIENVRQRPKAVRQRYAFISAVTFTAVVAGVWTLSLPARFTAVQDGINVAPPEAVTQTANVPFSGVWAQFKQQISALGGKSIPTILMTEGEAVDSYSSEDASSSIGQSVLLESGSTITFGSTTPISSTSTILLSTTSPASVTTSPAGQ